MGPTTDFFIASVYTAVVIVCVYADQSLGNSVGFVDATGKSASTLAYKLNSMHKTIFSSIKSPNKNFEINSSGNAIIVFLFGRTHTAAAASPAQQTHMANEQ